MIEINKIKEIYPGYFHVLLDFPEKKDILKILDFTYTFIWGINHIENSIEWGGYHHSLFSKFGNMQDIKVRNIEMEYLMTTQAFAEYVPLINQAINIIQINVEPPYYLDLKKFQGKPRYDMLRIKTDFLFELDMPASPDYTPLISPNKEFLESVIDKL
jgi:hypothetical protein